MFICFLGTKFFVLKFLFIELIESIYLILVQNVPALLRMYDKRYNITHKRYNTLPENV